MGVEVNEEFVGLYEVPAIDAETLAAVAKDTFTRLNLEKHLETENNNSPGIRILYPTRWTVCADSFFE